MDRAAFPLGSATASGSTWPETLSAARGSAEDGSTRVGLNVLVRRFAAGADATGDVDALDAATDDEIFALIDEELRSHG